MGDEPRSDNTESNHAVHNIPKQLFRSRGVPQNVIDNILGFTEPYDNMAACKEQTDLVKKQTDLVQDVVEQADQLEYDVVASHDIIKTSNTPEETTIPENEKCVIL